MSVPDVTDFVAKELLLFLSPHEETKASILDLGVPLLLSSLP